MESNMIMDVKDKEPKFSNEQLEIIKKYEVIVLYAKNFSRTQISKELNMYKTTVSRLIDRFLSFNDVNFKEDYKKGRHQILDTPCKTFIVQQLLEDAAISQKQLSFNLNRQLKKKVSQPTISRFLEDIGNYKRQKPIPIISLKNQVKRMDYCKYHTKKNDGFTNVIFSDESYFDIEIRKKYLC